MQAAGGAKVGAVVVSLLLLGGCSSATSDFAAQEQSPSYESVDDMRMVVESAGFDCSPFAYSAFDLSGVNALEVAVCGEGRPDGVVFITHTNAGQVAAYHEDRATQNSPLGIDTASLRGDTWSVTCDVDDCPSFQEMLGGAIVIIESSG